MTGFYVSVGLLTPEHMKRIGPALPEFLWLVAHETKEAGKVLNGSPITVERIADELGEAIRTTKRNLTRLCDEGYITRQRKYANEIYSYRVTNSKKWVHPCGDKNVPVDTILGDKNVPAAMTKMAPHGDKNGTANKEVDSIRQKTDRTPPTPPYHSVQFERAKHNEEVCNSVLRELEEMDRYRESNGTGQTTRSDQGADRVLGNEIKWLLR